MDIDRERGCYVFYDGACPLCQREIAWMRRRCEKESIGDMVWIDISQEDFRADQYGRTQEEFMARMHVYNQGTFYVAMDAVRVLYRKIGRGKWVNWTELFFLKKCADWMYSIFAYLRPRISHAKCRGNTCGRCL